MKMNSKLYIAAAGSGKTTTILNEVYDKFEKCSTDKYFAIITYTRRNQLNIKKRICEKFGFVPQKIKLMGWYEFLLDYWIRPFKGSVVTRLYDQHIGMMFVEGASGFVKGKNGKTFSTYRKENIDAKFLHNKLAYSDKLSEFSYLCYSKNSYDMQTRLSGIFESIYIDEVQDLSAWDYEILKVVLQKTTISCILCGDPRQHTYSTSPSTKNSRYIGRPDLYMKNCVNSKRKEYISIDYETLNVNHRSCNEICLFSNRVFPSYPEVNSCNCKDCLKKRQKFSGKGMFLLREADIDSFIKLYNPISLIWSESSSKKVKTSLKYNYGESKGLEADVIIIYPTKTIVDNFLSSGVPNLKMETQCKFYVAVTRARFISAIVVSNSFDNNNIGLPFWERP